MPEPKKRFTPEFCDEAVRLAHTSGRSRREIAADLGIGLSTLRAGEHFPAGGPGPHRGGDP